MLGKSHKYLYVFYSKSLSKNISQEAQYGNQVTRIFEKER